MVSKMLSLKFDWTLTKFLKEQLLNENSELMYYGVLYIDANDEFMEYYYEINLNIDMHKLISVSMHGEIYIDRMNIDTTKNKIKFLSEFIDNIYDPYSKISEIGQYRERSSFHYGAIISYGVFNINTTREYASHIIKKYWRKYYYGKRAKIIQRKWRYVITNPNHAVCRRRLMREFNELTA